MENVTTMIDQELVEGAAKIMANLAQRCASSQAEPTTGIYEDGTDGAAGESMAGMMILELQNGKTSSLEHYEKSIRQWRTDYASYFLSSEFRRAAKLCGREWATQESRRFGHIPSYPFLENTIDFLLNQAMSPIGPENNLNEIWCHGRSLTIGGLSDVSDLEDFHRRLPQFLGLFDYFDADVLKNLRELLPATLVSPTWYDKQEFMGMSIEDAMPLYESITGRYPTLKRPHVIDVHGGQIKQVTVMEIEETATAGTSFRCLIATPIFEGSSGSDVYFATIGRQFSGSGMLVAEAEYDPGTQVVYEVYKALGQAIKEEIREAVDIDALIVELGETDDLDEYDEDETDRE